MAARNMGSWSGTGTGPNTNLPSWSARQRNQKTRTRRRHGRHAKGATVVNYNDQVKRKYGGGKL